MASWSDPIGDLRRFLADSPNDNLIKEKRIFGDWQAGQNRTFYTFEDRLLASGNQAVCGKPLRIFYGGEEIAASGIVVTDQLRGEFQLLYVVPSGAQKRITASYYYQQSLDSELSMDLQQAAYQCNSSAADSVATGLQIAAINIAASLAHSRLAARWQQRKSSQFLLEDEPARKEADDLIRFHQEESKRVLEFGLKARESFYNLRNDRGKSPAFGVLSRVPTPYTPRR